MENFVFKQRIPDSQLRFYNYSEKNKESKNWRKVKVREFNHMIKILLRLKPFKSPETIRLYRQVSESETVAEAIVPNSPREKVNLYGSRKMREQAIEYCWLFTFFPELVEMWRIDNSEYEKEIFSFVSEVTEKIPYTAQSKEDLLFRTLLWLSYNFNVRSVGGWNNPVNLRIVRTHPRKPKETTFIRGYRDKGSIAPTDKRHREKANSSYWDKLEEVIRYAEMVSTKHSFARITKFDYSPYFHFFDIHYSVSNGYSNIEDSEERELFLKDKNYLQEVLDSFVSVNNLDGEKVAEDLNKLTA